MKNLIKNEVKLFFSKKNLILWLLFTAIIFISFKFIMIENFKNYNLKQSQKYEPYFVNAQTNANLLNEERKINNKEKNLEKNSKKPDQKKIEAFEQKEAVLDQIIPYWDDISFKSMMILDAYNSKYNEFSKINSSWADIDHNLQEIYDNKIDPIYPGIFLNEKSDWTSRKLLRVADSEKLNSKINYDYPTSTRALTYFTDGKEKMFTILLIIFVILLNFDMWSMEFEENEGKVLFLLPFSKKNIFFSRVITRMLMTLVMMILSFLALCIVSAIMYGFDLGLSKIYLKDSLTSLLNYNIDFSEAFKRYEVISSIKYLAISSLNTILFVLFIFSAVAFISLFSKDLMISLILSLFILVLILNVSSINPLNPFSYYLTDDILMGRSILTTDIIEIDRPLWFFILIEIALSILLNLISLLKIKRG
ncbi:MAG: ABC transporter permease subunit [Tissierellia bacterium]|nr:ABC transporter permease subunit [Tissierellia bacterium]